MTANLTLIVANNKMRKMKELVYKDLAYQLVGCFFEVYNSLGPAHKEMIYHRALCVEFDSKEIPFISHKQLEVVFKGQKIGIYTPDFIVDDKIVVEVKSLQQLPKVFEKQLFYYLRGSPYKLGYIVNFGSDKIDIRRRVYDSARFIE